MECELVELLVGIRYQWPATSVSTFRTCQGSSSASHAGVFTAITLDSAANATSTATNAGLGHQTWSCRRSTGLAGGLPMSMSAGFYVNAGESQRRAGRGGGTS